VIPEGLIAVVRASSTEECRTIVTGLVAADVPAIEVTMTVPGALDIVNELRDASAVIGIGTVLDVATCQEAVASGARFVVSPVTDPAVLQAAHDLHTDYVGGALTPSEIQSASLKGVDAIKIFPIGMVGGPAYLKSILEPFPGLRIVASGGVAIADIGSYRAAGAYSICIGGAFIDRNAARAGDVEGVRRHARSVVEAFERS